MDGERFLEASFQRSDGCQIPPTEQNDREEASFQLSDGCQTPPTERNDREEIEEQSEDPYCGGKPLSPRACRYLVMAIVGLAAIFTLGVVLASRTSSSASAGVPDLNIGPSDHSSDPLAPSPTLPLNSPFYISIPEQAPTLDLPIADDGTVAYSVVLESGAKMLPDERVSSPNGMFTFAMKPEGDLILYRTKTGDVLWQVEGDGAAYLAMQPDGNLLLRRSDRSVVWRSVTSTNVGAYLRVTNNGQTQIVKEDGSSLWFAGVPRGQYTSAPSSSLTFPIRGAFYYPWFPETWTVRGSLIQFNPTLGFYSNDDGDLQEHHAEALNYAHVDLAIASWWGPNQKLDRARITNLMDKSAKYDIKWTVYHEEERQSSPNVDQLRYDLAYIKKWFAWHESWAHIDGKPLIFVWNHNSCDVPARWIEAANGEWYVVPKLWGDHDECPTQPDHWHQYGPAKAVVHQPGYSFSVSPGFYHATADSARLPRVSMEDWRSNVQHMVDSNEPWQLITTFNEWGEGTAVESADEWATTSGFGAYCDVLHEIP